GDRRRRPGRKRGDGPDIAGRQRAPGSRVAREPGPAPGGAPQPGGQARDKHRAASGQGGIATFHSHMPREPKARAMSDRLISAAVSVILGALVWLYSRSRDQEMLDAVPIPVTILLAPNQADQYDLEVTGQSQVLASFSGPPSRIRELRGQLQRGELRV